LIKDIRPLLVPVRPGIRRLCPIGSAVATRRFQSGVINDYITWLVLGLAVLGGVLTLITTS